MTQKIKVLLFISILLVIAIMLYLSFRTSPHEVTPVIENKSSIDNGNNASIINNSQNKTGKTENIISIPLEKPPANVIGG